MSVRRDEEGNALWLTNDVSYDSYLVPVVADAYPNHASPDVIDQFSKTAGVGYRYRSLVSGVAYGVYLTLDGNKVSTNPLVADIPAISNEMMIARLLAIEVKTALIGTGAAFTNAPVSETGQLDVLVAGDDYSTSNGNEIEWTVDLPLGTTLGSPAKCFFGGYHTIHEYAAANSWLVEGAISAGPTASQAVITFNWLTADNSHLIEGRYKYSAEIHNDAGLVVTRVLNDDQNLVKIVRRRTLAPLAC